jgi:hypothetical protein
MPRWAAASRRFHCMPLLLEPGGGPLGRPLVGAFDRLVGDVLWRTVVDSHPCPSSCWIAASPMPSAYSRDAQACRSTCGVSLVTAPRRCRDAAWLSAAAKVSPPIGPAPLRRQHHRQGQFPVVGELAADLGHPPHQQRPGVAEHRHQPLPRPRPARALAHPHVDLAQRAVPEMQVLQPQLAQLGSSKPTSPARRAIA